LQTIAILVQSLGTGVGQLSRDMSYVAV